MAAETTGKAKDGGTSAAKAAPAAAPEPTQESMDSARIVSLERQLSDLSRERREEASKKDAEIADLKSRLSRSQVDAATGRPVGPGLSPPMNVAYYLQKRKDRISQTGGRVQVWDTLPNTQSAEPYRAVPDWLAYSTGAGTYRCADQNGNQFGSLLTVAGDDPDVIATPVQGTPQAGGLQGPVVPASMAPPMQPGMMGGQPALGGTVLMTPAGQQVVVPSALDRALALYDAAVARRDANLQQQALKAIERAADKSGGGSLQDFLQDLKAKNETEAELKKALGIPSPNPMLPAGPGITINAGGQPVPGQPMSWPSDPAAQQSMVELMAQREATAATQQMYATLAEKAGSLLEGIAARIAGPKANAADVTAAGARLAGMQPGAVPQLPPAQGPVITTYAPPASGQRPAAPAAPPPAMQPPRPPPAARPPPQAPPSPPAQAGPRVPGRNPGGVAPQDGNPNSFVRCADCLEDMTLQEFLDHLNFAQCPAAPGYQQPPGGPSPRSPGTKAAMPGPPAPKGKPAAPAAAPATPAPAGAPVPVLPAATPPAAPVPEGTPTPAAAATPQPALPEGVRKYLGYMAQLTGYIQSFQNGDAQHSPESIADIVWTLAPELDRQALLELLVDGGFDKVLGSARPFLDGLLTYPASLSPDPAKRQEQYTLLVDALNAAKLVDPTKLASVADLDGPVNLLKGHIAIQTEGDGKVWICRFLNQLARKAEKPLPHPEVLPKENKRETL